MTERQRGGRLPHRSLRPFRQLRPLRCVRCVRCVGWKPRFTEDIIMHLGVGVLIRTDCLCSGAYRLRVYRRKLKCLTVFSAVDNT